MEIELGNLMDCHSQICQYIFYYRVVVVKYPMHEICQNQMYLARGVSGSPGCGKYRNNRICCLTVQIGGICGRLRICIFGLEKFCCTYIIIVKISQLLTDHHSKINQEY